MSADRILVASLLLIRLCCCWAILNNPISRHRLSLAGIHSSSTSTDSSYSEECIRKRTREEHHFTGEYKYSGLELWLDLRGTSLTPRTALKLWAMEGQNDNENTPDGRAPPFVKCLASSTEISYNSPPLESYDDIDVLIVEEWVDDNDDMKYITQQQTYDPSPSSSNYCIGRILNLQASSSKPILPDPLPAMEHACNGQWIIIDTDGWKKIEVDERLRMALPLLELISSSCATASTKSASNRGGIGLTCHTNDEVVKTIMFIQSMMAGGGGNGRQVRTKTLTSGIVIPEDNMSLISAGANEVSTTHHFAIVVPYDIELLRTAQLLLGE